MDVFWVSDHIISITIHWDIFDFILLLYHLKHDYPSAPVCGWPLSAKNSNKFYDSTKSGGLPNCSC